jgi:hypothetical protein
MSWCASNTKAGRLVQCVEVDAVTGDLRLVDPPPVDAYSCSMVVGSASEFASPLVQMSEADGLSIAAMIMGIWAIAWGFRQVADVLSSGETSERE